MLQSKEKESNVSSF